MVTFKTMERKIKEKMQIKNQTGEKKSEISTSKSTPKW